MTSMVSAIRARRDGDDGFLDELLEPPQRTERGAGVDRADAAGMAGAPGLQEIERFGAAHFADRDAVRAQTQGGADEIDSEITPSLVRSATRFGALHCSSRPRSERPDPWSSRPRPTARL